MIDQPRTRQRPGPIDMMLGEAADRLDRDVRRRVVFDRQGRHVIVVGLRLAAGGQADQVGLDRIDLAVGQNRGAKYLDLELALAIGGVGRSGNAGERQRSEREQLLHG